MLQVILHFKDLRKCTFNPEKFILNCDFINIKLSFCTYKMKMNQKWNGKKWINNLRVMTTRRHSSNNHILRIKPIYLLDENEYHYMHYRWTMDIILTSFCCFFFLLFISTSFFFHHYIWHIINQFLHIKDLRKFTFNLEKFILICDYIII